MKEENSKLLSSLTQLQKEIHDLKSMSNSIVIPTTTITSTITSTSTTVTSTQTQTEPRISNSNVSYSNDTCNINATQLQQVLHVAQSPFHFIRNRSIRLANPNINTSNTNNQTANDNASAGVTSSNTNTRRFSHFRCSGDEKSSSSGFLERICVFENTCYNSKTKSIEYYTRPNSPQVLSAGYFI
jgi:hypothetical protein